MTNPHRIYDGDNLRCKIVAGSVTTTFVWDGADYLQIKPSSGDATLLVVLEGEVVGHVKGSEKRDYIVDPLGSVVAYLNSSQALTDQFEYWPYGELIAEIEAGTEPFLWVGSLGYFRESDLRTYIRAREYRQDLGSWMQLDPLWPGEQAFAYALHQPTSAIDLSGTQTKISRILKQMVPQILQKPFPAALIACALTAGTATVGAHTDVEALFLDVCEDCCIALSASAGAIGLTWTGPWGSIGCGVLGYIVGATECSRICYCILYPKADRCKAECGYIPPHTGLQPGEIRRIGPPGSTNVIVG